MKEIGFVKPNYPHERRVALLPKDILQHRENFYYKEIYIEQGFGSWLNIQDEEYSAVGCHILSREQIFKLPTIFSLKLIQPSDYQLLSEGQHIIGWMHPNGSGKDFCQTIAKEKRITIFDIDSVYPRIYTPDGQCRDVSGLPKHFFWKNSYIAGMAATKLGIEAAKLVISNHTKIAILGSGSVAQGAFYQLAQSGYQPRMFYRKTLDVFYDQISEFDLIINGIEVDVDGFHIIDNAMLAKTKQDVLIIDAAADAGRAIEGTSYLSLDAPISVIQQRQYTLVNNAPTLMHEDASKVISDTVASLLISDNFIEN